MAKFRKPSVYTKAFSTPPLSIADVETAIPAFIGYTEEGPDAPTKIGSMVDYTNTFGGPYQNEIGEFKIDKQGIITTSEISTIPKYMMYYMLEMFFANGGGDCFIISVGNYDDEENSVKNEAMKDGLNLLNKEDLPTLILFPDATSSKNSGDASELYKAALAQCAERKDRFLICDVEQSEEKTNIVSKSAEDFRYSIGTNDLKFGAAYFPSLQTTLTYTYAEEDITVYLKGTKLVLRHRKETIKEDPDPIKIAEVKATSLYHKDNGAYKDRYREIKRIINSIKLELPPSAAVAGVYVRVDSTRGVWKAPANVSLNMVKAPKLKIDDKEQADLNVSSTGKSINAIRSFEGKGILVWGARTMDGNNNEWRYISVRRFFNMAEKSIKNALECFIFEPNDANTWMKVKTLIENYLTTLWRAGALTGAKPEQAFFVKVGLGHTMTPQDVLEGNMIVEMGMAVIRPAEFIILKFFLKMKTQ